MTQAVLTKSNPTITKVLVVEDDKVLREALVDTLELGGIDADNVDSAEAALKLLARSDDIHMVISDVNMGGMSGHDLLAAIKTDYPHIPVLLITAYATVSQSVEAIRQGAVDYLVKPFPPEVLLKAVAEYSGCGGVSNSEAPVAADASSQRLLALADRVAQGDSTVLIVGESGTGKEVLARYIHNQSPRANQPYVAINCAAIPDNMLESILFGHEKGAYTGAYSSSPGKFEQANGGTLLLDEISEMPLALQAKLLRVLQEREVERLGGKKTITLDVRVIATSNRDLPAAVAAGDFREDLYYRLSVLPLQWAPLRERRADIVPLAQSLLVKHATKQHRGGVRFTQAALDALSQHPWPGNVRELDNVVQRALILQPNQIIDANDLGFEYSAANNPAIPSQEGPTTPALPFSKMEEEGAPLEQDLQQREYEIIVKTLQEAGGRKDLTAERLGISPRTLRYKIARLREQGLCVNEAIGACP